MGKRWKRAEKNLAKASRTATKIIEGTKTILNALPTLNTEALNKDYSNTFNGDPESFFNTEEPTRRQQRNRQRYKPRKVVYY
jgi:hypothetical protein